VSDDVPPVEPLRPGAAWVLISRRPELGVPVWFFRAKDALDALSRISARASPNTYYLCRLETACGPQADRLPIGTQSAP